MHRSGVYLATMITLLLSVMGYCDEASDSLFVGRECKIVLSYGFEAEGTITRTNPDTVWLRTKYKELGIPVKDIKFVLNPEEEPSELGFDSTVVVVVSSKVDTTDECNVYLSSKSVLKDVELVFESDSTLIAVKEKKPRRIWLRDIRKIVFKPVAPFGTGFLIGGGVGFLIGFIPAVFAGEGGEWYLGGRYGFLFGLVMAVPCGLIGGVVGLIGSKDDVYNFDKGLSHAKVKRMKYVMKKHS